MWFLGAFDVRMATQSRDMQHLLTQEFKVGVAEHGSLLHSCAIVASIVSPSQDRAAYPKVLRDALHVFGSPQAIVSDGGTVFKANSAKAVYAALGIRPAWILLASFSL